MPHSPKPRSLPDGTEHWDRYWAHGFLTSCAAAFKGNYEGSMRRLWDDFFSTLGAGSRILDICTGNGAIAVFANQVSRDRGKTFEIHGVDQAVIDPGQMLKSQADLVDGVVFHSRTPAEATPFPDAHFDAVTGQYALEYTPIQETVTELSRITAPGAEGLFVIHNDASIVLEVAREELEASGILFDESLVFERARDVVLSMATANTPEKRQALSADPLAQQRRDAFNAAAARVTEAAENARQPDMLQTALGHLSEALQHCFEWGLQDTYRYLDNARRDIEANVERLKDLGRVSSDESQAREILAMFQAAGFETDPLERIHHDMPLEGARAGDTRLMGWVLRVRKT